MFLQTFSRLFPTPHALYPPAAGLDITDASVKWLELAPHGESFRVLSYGFEPLPEGIVVNGVVEDVEGLAAALTSVRMKWKGHARAHAALPEEAAYVFSIHVPKGSSREHILSAIEFEFEGRVPLPIAQAVYDFDIVEEHGAEGMEVSVAAFPKALANSYVEACALAGIELLSLELEARSIARAVCSPTSLSGAYLLADFGRNRTGFAILKHCIPIFTTTVNIGGRGLTEALMKKLSLSEDGARAFKNEHGLVPGEGIAAGTESALALASAFADEVLQQYHFWNTRRNPLGEREVPLSGVLLVGGSANLRGLADYVSGRVQAPVERPNVWRNVCNFDEYIPPIERRASLQYATVIGLALRGHM